MGVLLEPLGASIVGDVRQPLLVLLGAVGFVLLIACANIANVLLARGTARRAEMALRTALGASRRQLAAQVGVESLLLALAGGTLGVLLAYVGLEGLVGLAPPSLPRLDAIRLDGSVLGVAALVTVLCGMLFGLVPALDAGGRGPAEAIKQGAWRDRAPGRGAAGAGGGAVRARGDAAGGRGPDAAELREDAGGRPRVRRGPRGCGGAESAGAEVWDARAGRGVLRGAVYRAAGHARGGVRRWRLPLRAGPAARQCADRCPGASCRRHSRTCPSRTMR
jgi:HAMP domain-containing protein